MHGCEEVTELDSGADDVHGCMLVALTSLEREVELCS